MRPTTLARMVLAVSLAALGVLSLLSGDFALDWQPVPAWLPWRAALASISGLVLLAGGVGVLVPRTAIVAARVLAAYLLLWLLLLRVAWVVPHPLSAALWLGVGENLVLAAGGWILLQTIVESPTGVRLAQLLFGIALPITPGSSQARSRAVHRRARLTRVPWGCRRLR